MTSLPIIFECHDTSEKIDFYEQYVNKLILSQGHKFLCLN